MPNDDLSAYLDPAPRSPRERVHSIASRIGITPDLADDYLKVTRIESGHNVNVGDSPKGAKGFGQVMPDRPGLTTRTIGGRRYDLRNPDENIEAGLKLFSAGGSDPVARRLEYFGGAGARRRYERTGKIPNISDGNMTAQEYVRATSGQMQQPKSDLDAYLDPTPTPTPTPRQRQVAKQPERPSSLYGRAFGPPVNAITQEAIRQGVADVENRRQIQPPPGPAARLLRQYGQQRAIEQSRREEEEQARKDIAAERQSRRVPFTTLGAMVDLINHPISSVVDRLTKSEDQIVAEKAAERVREQRLARTPEVTEIRKEYGRMPAAVRAPASAVIGTGGAGLLKKGAWLASAFDIAPNQLSDWMNKRADVIGAGAAATPLEEQRNLSSLVSGQPELKEIEQGVPEKILKGVSDLGVTIGEIILLQKATKLSMPKLLALEGVARNNGKSTTQQMDAAANGFALGSALESHLSRTANAALFGLPTAAQTGYEVSQGRMSPLDAAIQTGIQAGAGAVLTGPKPKQRGRPMPETFTEQRQARIEAQQREGSQQRYANIRRRVNEPLEDLFDESQGKVQPSVETQRAETEPVERTAPTVTESAMDAVPRREDVSRSVPQESTPARFFHRDFGEVTESPNQRRVGKGRVRVTAEDGTEHVIKRSAMTGRGNERAVPIREPEPTSEFVDQFRTAPKQDVGEAGGVSSASSPASSSRSKPTTEQPTAAPPPVESTLRPAATESQLSQTKGEQRPVTEEVRLPPSESTTSARRQQMSADRAELDLPELPPVQRKSWQRSLSEAKPEQANRLADEVLNKPRALNDTETASVVVRAQQVKNEHAAKLREIEQAKEADLPRLQGELGTLEREFDLLSTAAKQSGTEKGRALAAQKLTINQDFDLVSLVARFKAAAGRDPKPAERTQIEQLVKENSRLEAALAKAEETRAREGIQQQIDRVKRTQRRTRNKAELDAEWADLKSQFAEIRQRNAEFFKSEEGGFDLDRLRRVYRRMRPPPREPIHPAVEAAGKRYGELVKEIMDLNGRIGDAGGQRRPLPESKVRELRERHTAVLLEAMETEKFINREGYKVNPLGEVAKPTEHFPSSLEAMPLKEKLRYFFSDEGGTLDPEAVKLIGKMVRNRVQAGVVKAEELVDEIHAIVGGDKRELRDAISGYRTRPAQRQSELQQQVNALKSELRQLSTTEDVAAGRRTATQQGPAKEFKRDQTRRKQIERQIADLEQQMTSGRFRDRSQKEPPRYTRETYRLQKELDATRAQYERLKYRATASTGRKVTDTALGVGNLPKTMLSMGDFSALLRQGGYGYVTHPILSTRAAHDMLRSISERGFANVEAEIKSHPLFEDAKRNGVEFTGVDRLDPRLSKHEEGYLGSGAIDAISKGKYNPLGYTLKPIKDISERTFVSFLDSQRMRVYAQQAEAIRSMKLTPEQTQAALKAQAKFINAMTGRGDLGVRGNAAAPLLNMAMFSPRLLVSRLTLLNKMFNPVAWKNLPEGARKQIMTDNVKFLGFTLVSLGMAKAAGLGVNLDWDDSEFLKIKVGNTRYDVLTGLQQPMRLFLRMVAGGGQLGGAIRGGETYGGEPAGKIIVDFTRSKASPEAGYVWDALEGKNRMTGKRFEAGKDATRALIPLPMQDFQEAIKTDGVARGFVEALPSLVGIGAQTYAGAAEKPTTRAEKLARKLARPDKDEARVQEEIDTDAQRSQLRARARRGEDVSADLNKLQGKITDRQVKAILAARNKTRLQEDMNRLGVEEAVLVYSVANSQQRAELKSLLERKASTVNALLPERQQRVRQMFQELGIRTPPMRPIRPPRLSYTVR